MASNPTIVIELQGIGRMLINRSISVPIYQRSYAWEDDHVMDLFNDINRARTDGAQEYFIGSIVTTRNQTNRSEVADGQQRLATISILIAAIRDYFYEKGDKERANQITLKLLNEKDLRTLEMIPKLKLNDIDNDYFMKRVLSLPGEQDRTMQSNKPSHKRLDKAAKLAKDHLQQITPSVNPTEALTDLIGYITDLVKVIWVQVPDDANAFTIFETLNDRGLALAITDLLKNHLFGLSGPRVAEVQHYWRGMVNVLEMIGEDNVILSFIRHYWSSLHGLVREKDLYADIKKRVSNQTAAVGFSKALEAHAQLYAAIINTNDSFWSKHGDTCRRQMETINILRMVQMRPLILSILAMFTGVEFKKAIRNMLSWSVRFLIHGGLGSGALETQYCQAAREIRDKKISTAAQLYGRLSGIIPNDAQFRQSFATASVSKSFLARYYLRGLEEHERGGREPELVPNENAEVISLEHILPQHLSPKWAHISADDHALLINRLGNLALMKAGVNAKSGNDDFTSKKKLYAKSEYKLTSNIAKIRVWDRRAIENRQEHMADIAILVWPAN